jgi:hypothetical protein
MSRCWLFNLAAEEELDGKPLSVKAPAPVKQRARGLMRPRDLELAGAVDARGLVGQAWMMTPQAAERLRKAGARVDYAPSLGDLRRWNSRAFSVSLRKSFESFPQDGQISRFIAYCTHINEVDDAIAAASGVQEWIAHRDLGFAGRGKFYWRSHEARDRLHNFCAGIFARNLGIELAPRVQIAAEFGIHGWCDGDAEGSTNLEIGLPTTQVCTRQGQWLETRRSTPEELSAMERDALMTAAKQSGSALLAEGYRGPFGVDAFRYRLGDNQGFHALSELNVRYTMGWAMGMEQT